MPLHGKCAEKVQNMHWPYYKDLLVMLEIG